MIHVKIDIWPLQGWGVGVRDDTGCRVDTLLMKEEGDARDFVH